MGSSRRKPWTAPPPSPKDSRAAPAAARSFFLLARPARAVMTHQNLAPAILERLLERYGPLLSSAQVAAELGLSLGAFHARKSRGMTQGWPDPIEGFRPNLFRATEFALWLAGDPAPDVPSPAPPKKRGPGRPRRMPDREMSNAG